MLVDSYINDTSGIGNDGNGSINRFGSWIAACRNGDMKRVALLAFERDTSNQITKYKFVLVSGNGLV